MEVQDGAVLGGSLEAITAAKAIGDVTAVVIGSADAAAAAAAYAPVLSADAAVTCDDEILYILEQAVQAQGADAVFFSATKQGKDLAPRLAARLGSGCVTDVIDIKDEDGSVKYIRPAFGGSIWEELEFAAGKVHVLSTRGGSFAKPEAGEAAAAEEFAVEIPAEAVKAKFIEKTVEITEAVNLEGADIVVTGGRGCGSAEVFGLVEELAGVLGGVVGATRPVIDEGWVSRAHQVGQSGKNVAPKLYIACGVSGSMQHVSGMSGSDYIVSINKDEDAPIFSISDVGIVGRCEEILPLLIEEFKKRKA